MFCVKKSDYTFFAFEFVVLKQKQFIVIIDVTGIQACSYPGTTISGRMSSVKFYYKIGENITFSCEENLVLKGAAMLKCLKNGKWSNTIPTCVSPDQSR